jgi:hypothetical protein
MATMSAPAPAPAQTQPVNGQARLSDEVEVGFNCPTDKKQFATRQQATEFSARLKNDYPDEAPQYPYPCEQCGSYHLTTQTAESYGMVVSKLGVPPIKRTRNTYTDADRQRCKMLRQQSMALREISEKTGIKEMTIRNWFSHDATMTGSKALSVDSIEEQEKMLKAQLASLERQKQVLIEAKALKLSPCWDGKGILISKEGERMGLKLEDARELVSKLEKYLTSPGTFGAAAGKSQ